jgi:polysaccharide export outer membrane protein
MHASTLALLVALFVTTPVVGAPRPQADGGRQNVPPDSYIVGPQDQLSITVFEESELTGKYRVDSDGWFSFPLLERVRAAGRTVSELQATLTALLANGFLKNPQVRVEIDQYKSQSVFVSGEVRAPGKILMSGNSMTLLEALAQAGSPTQSASNEITVTRRDEAADSAEPTFIRVNRRDLEVGRAGYDILLRDGDIINVPPAKRFYIAGQVRNPGFYVLEPGMSVQQAIALAGGLTERGSNRGIIATRIVNGKAADVAVKLEDAVEPNDTLNIRQRFF